MLRYIFVEPFTEAVHLITVVFDVFGAEINPVLCEGRNVGMLYARERCLTHDTNFQRDRKKMQTESNTNQRRAFARFPLGQTYITPGAEEALMIAVQTGIEFLRRHVSGDFGELTDADLLENELSLRKGFRVLSTYRTSRGDKLWIITEADRSSTTILLPDEY